MIRVTIDVLGPAPLMLAELRIVNDGTGTDGAANYKIALETEHDRSHAIFQTRVTGYDRTRGAYKLIEIALHSLTLRHSMLGVRPK